MEFDFKSRIANLYCAGQRRLCPPRRLNRYGLHHVTPANEEIEKRRKEVKMSRKDRDGVSKQQKQNALVHGVYSRDLILPWESRKEFERLYADLCLEFNPQGRMERETVLDLAHLRWQKQRIRRMWHAGSYKDPFVMDLVQSGQKSWSGIRRYLRNEAKDYRVLTKPLRQLCVELAEQAQEINKTPKGEEDSEPDARERQLRSIISVMNDQLLPLIRELEFGPNAENTLKRAYSPSYLDPIVRLEALIDGRIDKALGRIAALKAYKKLQLEQRALARDDLTALDLSTRTS
jgi:hypothetical protein